MLNFKKIGKKNICLLGLMGSGKSIIGKELSNIYDTNFFDSDLEIEKKENLNELSKYLGISGNTKIKVLVVDEKNKFLFELKNKRKLNSGLVKDLRKHDFVRKISI